MPCPVDDHARQWIEQKLDWLRTAIGPGMLQDRAIVLPTEKFFPFRYDESDAAVARMFRAVSKLMDVDPDRVKVFIDDDRQEFWPVDEDGNPVPLGAGGEFEIGPDGPMVSISRAELHNPEMVAATFAHELAHLRLYDARADFDAFDRELLTDLTAVHLGFGVFIANDPRVWMAHVDVWPGTDLAMPRYITPEMTTYALALGAHRKKEEKPVWLRHLNQDATANAKGSIQYLFEES
jgi:hypothetical protein